MSVHIIGLHLFSLPDQPSEEQTLQIRTGRPMMNLTQIEVKKYMGVPLSIYISNKMIVMFWLQANQRTFFLCKNWYLCVKLIKEYIWIASRLIHESRGETWDWVRCLSHFNDFHYMCITTLPHLNHHQTHTCHIVK